ncbi:manganese efflux pump MntP family protein [Asaccharospora irregularis]|uniref:Putative Mn2+ efflux pump MntP n=1 Tax=Asaccharospora irregularis DSM 2635 TaxID=1121321 RepID=A0A1M5PG88_9FIRM|nr:manganese efflux pump [Asaccharospora irregularis]SHH00785.1 Putative Mn2+ efflux pump MntP [Asaccharospora irregularis DSM 2635]
MTDLGLLQTLIISFIFTLDAFFVSVAYGMSGISLKKTFTLASLVSLFCGISIVLGLFIGDVLLKNNYIYTLIGTIIFGFGFNMIFQKNQSEIPKELTFLNILLFSLSLSIDSFSISIALSSQYNITLVSIFIFCLVSFVMTISGLLCGKVLSKSNPKHPNVFQGVAMCIISYRMLLKLR